MDRIIRIKLDSRQAEQGIDRLDNDMRGLGRTSDGIQTKLTAVASALAAAFSVQQITAYADAYTNIQNRLRVVTDSTEQLTRVTASLLQTANDTRASFDATSSLYSTLARSTEELAISEERLIAITKTVNQSFAVSGASADEAANAIRQLSQGLAAGALRGDEFNSVAEQAPGILRAVAAETGKSVGQLREFAAEGGITAELLIRAIENYSDTVQSEFDKTNRTFQQSTVVAQNNATAFIGSSELVKQATSEAGNALVFLSQNLEALSNTFITVSAVVAGRYVVAMGAAAVAAVASTKATISATIAENAQAQAAFFAANGIKVKDIAVKQATISQVAYATALRASSAAMSFLAGPAGLILLAASAFLVFANNSEQARIESEKSVTVNELLTQSYDDLTQAQIRNTKFVVEQKIKELEQQQAAIQKTADLTNDLSQAEARSFAAFTGAKVGVDELGNAADAAASKVDGLQSDIDKLNARLGELNNAKPAEAISKSAETEFERLRSLASGINSLFSGDLNLFGSEQPQSDESANRINERIAAIKLETQTLGSELSLQQGIRQGFISQEQAQLDLQTANKIQQAITERELLLAEKTITDQQRLETESAFNANLIAITQSYEEQKTEIARQQALTRMQIESDTQQTYLETTQIALGALTDLLGGSTGAVKALKLLQAGANAFQIFAASETAAALILATPPGPVLNPSLIGLANAVRIKGKISAGAVLAAGAASTFGGGGSSGGFSGGGGGSSSPATLPTTPQSAPQVQTLEIRGLDEIRDELRNQDGMVSTRFVATILDKISDANRIRGEG